MFFSRAARPTRHSLLLLAALAVTPAAATVVTTAIDEDDGELGGGSGISLREAVAYSPPDSTITFAPALSGQTIRFSVEETSVGIPITVVNSLSIDGSTLDSPVTIDAQFGNAFIIAAEAEVSVTSLSIIQAGFAFANRGTLTLDRCTISENLSINSSEAVIINTGTISITGTIIRGSDVIPTGLAIMNRAGSMVIRDTIIKGHRAANSSVFGDAGGIVNSDGTLDLIQVTIENNTGGFAGGIANFGGTVSIHNSMIASNTSSSVGGVFSTGGSLSITESTIKSNSGDLVGGILSDDTKTCISRSTISRNTGGIGGVAHSSPFTLEITLSTFEGNSGCAVGGISVDTPCRILASTIVNNSSSVSSLGGVFGGINSSGQIEVLASIIRDNLGGDVFTDTIEGSLVSLGSNIVGDSNAIEMFSAPGDQVGTASPILLAPLGNYGGPTQTMHPLAGSPAIGAATLPSTITIDQRGKSRSSTSDVGAVDTGQPIVVTTATDDSSSGMTLRQAIAEADDNGQTIHFDPSVFPATIKLESELALNSGKFLLFDASDIPGGVILDAQNRSRAIAVGDGASLLLHSMNIQGGNAKNSEDGAGIRNSSELILVNCELRSNTTEGGRGGGLWNSGSAQIYDSKILSNSSTLGGGLWSSGVLQIRDSTFGNNRTSSQGCGGGIMNTGDGDIVDSEIRNNHAGTGLFETGGGGGGIHNQGTLAITSCTISGNRTGDGTFESGSTGIGGHGGGILNTGRLEIIQTVVSNNLTGQGRNATQSDARSSLPDTTPARMGGSGGGIANEGTLVLEDCQIIDNITGIGGYDNATGGINTFESQSGHGGGIWNVGQAIIEDCEFRVNRTGSSPEFTGLLISSIGGDGGGIANFGGLDLRSSTIDGNETGSGISFPDARGASGGGLYNAGQLFAETSTFSNNIAPAVFGRGGGISNHSQDDSSFEQCTIHGNTAPSGAGFVNISGNVELIHCTITDNLASEEGGGGVAIIGATNGETKITNSIIRDNAGGDVDATIEAPVESIVTGGGNVIGTGNALDRFDRSSDRIGESIPSRLTPLGDYGGLTQTRLPIPGSPVIDIASQLSSEDQRGMPRFSMPDAGAVEFQNPEDLAFVLSAIWVEDPDDDGVELGVEFLLGSDPLTVATPPRTLQLSLNSSGEPELTMRIRERAVGEGVWVIQRSEDLTVWTEVFRSPDPNNSSATSLDLDPVDLSTLLLTDTGIMAPAYYRFVAERISEE